jgi:hypothetical protein
MWMNVIVSATVLVLAVAAFFFYDLISFRQNLIRSLRTSAQIVGANSVSALLFDDPQSAATTLQALHSSPDVASAVLVTSDGSTFAEYQRSPTLPPTPMRPIATETIDQDWVSGSHVLLAHRVVFQGKPAGIVYIAAELNETGQRARQYLLIACGVLLVCMGAGLLISATARRLVAQPMVALAETARRVSRERDYSVRAEPHPDGDEIAVLVDAFNEMLVEISGAGHGAESWPRTAGGKGSGADGCAAGGESRAGSLFLYGGTRFARAARRGSGDGLHSCGARTGRA